MWATGRQWLAAVGCCLWDDGDKEQVPRGRGYAAVVGGATPHYPEYAVGGVDQQQLALLVEERILVVGEVVAYQLGSAAHAERLETVGGVPVAEGEGQRNGVGVEEHLVRREAARHGGVQ